jgi:hypothetical protein
VLAQNKIPAKKQKQYWLCKESKINKKTTEGPDDDLD